MLGIRSASLSLITNSIYFVAVIARQELSEEMQKRLTANQRVQDQIRHKLSREDTRVPRSPKVILYALILLNFFILITDPLTCRILRKGLKLDPPPPLPRLSLLLEGAEIGGRLFWMRLLDDKRFLVCR